MEAIDNLRYPGIDDMDAFLWKHGLREESEEADEFIMWVEDRAIPWELAALEKAWQRYKELYP